MVIITMEFVSATVKRDKVRRMVEKGTIKKLAREKEGMKTSRPKVAEKIEDMLDRNVNANGMPEPSVVFL